MRGAALVAALMTTFAALRSAAGPDGDPAEVRADLTVEPSPRALPDPVALPAPGDVLDGAKLAADAAVAAELAAREDAARRASEAAAASTPEPAPSTPTEQPRATTESAPAALSSRAEQIITGARGFFGVPYLWGGITRAGMDCSGLVYTVLRSMGLNPPRTAAQQARWTIRIPASEARPGDLVFLGSPATHVGIFIGDGRMIDSSTPGTVIKERPILAGAYFGRIP